MFFVLISLPKTVAYASYNNLEVSDYPDDHKQKFFDNLNLSVLESEPDRTPIKCFDVDENGNVVLGINTSPNTVCAYGKDGSFLYGYSFECYGDYLVTWYEGEVLLLFYRGEAAVSVDSLGKCMDVYRLDFSSSQNKAYIDDIAATTKQRRSVRYQLTPEHLFSRDYARLEMTNSDGEKTVLYDASSAHATAVSIRWILFALLSPGTVLILINYLKRFRKH